MLARSCAASSLWRGAARILAAPYLPVSCPTAIHKMFLSLTRFARPCLAFLSLISILFTGATAEAQNVGGRSEIFAGSDLERYLRYLQTLGLVGVYPWTIRDFGPAEIDSLVPRQGVHPWAARYDLAPHEQAGRLTFDYVRPTTSVRFNSAFPYGSNDGPIWAGRGFTEAFQAGVRARWRALSLTIAPMAFTAENAAFPLMYNGFTSALAFGDRQYPDRVDRPQRFGTRPYSIFDPGESSFRIDTRLVSAGISTAEQYWGPADTYPFILGNNAAGFPHVFIGTGMPWNLWIGHLQGRLVYGQLSQTEYASVGTGATHRLMSGLILTFQPRPIPGFELGAARFFHTAWPDSGGLPWGDIRLPFEGFLKGTLRNAKSGDDDANQLASIYARWVAPHSGLEFYSEFGREDHSWNLRDFVLEPNHASTLMFGFRKAWMSTPQHLLAVRGEILDMRLNTLTKNRGIGAGYYVNGTIPQGHTERGQLLGADITAGSGAGAVIAVDRYDPTGRWTYSWTRTLIDRYATYFADEIRPPRAPEAEHAFTLERVRFIGRLDLRTALTAVYDLNRYFERDVLNLNMITSARWSW